MAELFNITHDANNLNEYDSTVTDGGDLSTGTPGLAGTTAKMECLVDDTNVIYGQMNQTAPASDQIRLRFYLDPNSIFGNAGDSSYLLRMYTTDGNPVWDWALVSIENVAGTLGLYFVAFNDAGGGSGWTHYPITDDVHYVELHFERSANGNDGQARFWIDGVLKKTVSSFDNRDTFANLGFIRMGAIPPANISGTFHLDELKANDDGGEIGPVAAGIAPQAMHHYRMRRAAQCG